MLRLIEQGQLAVSDKTLLPGATGLRALSALLHGGDFYPELPEARDREAGPMRAFAWPLLVQAAGFAELHGKRLALTKAGREAIGRPAAATLHRLWERWRKYSRFDELSRIDAIKGQQGKGKRGLTAVADRRTVIEMALRRCPVGAWVSLDELSRYMQAAGLAFEVTRDPWGLYLAEPGYGALGYSGSHGWDILQRRYLACLLFEYAATLGMVDVAFVPPEKGPRNSTHLWGSEDLLFLSRYDGLAFLRLTPLGAFCVGLADDYRPARSAPAAMLAVRGNLSVEVTGGRLAAAEALFLDGWAERRGEGVWQLDRARFIEAVERGQDPAELREFLAARDPQPLPETVEGFIAATARQARALKEKGSYLLIECDEAAADRIAADPVAKGLCLRTGARYLAVRPEQEARFRAAVRGMGLGVMRG